MAMVPPASPDGARASKRWRHVRGLVHSMPWRFAVFLLVSLIVGLPMLDQAIGMNAFHDAQYLSGYERDARLTVLQFQQLPLWDPYACGGMYGLGSPTTRYASPFFLLSLWFDVDPASSLLAVLLPALGMEGMFRYARSWGARAFAAFLFAPLYPLSGFFPYSFHWGWIQFFSYCLIPWSLWSLRAALRGDRRGWLLCALSVTITAGFGGTYTLPMAVVLVLGELGDALLPGRLHAAAFRVRAKHVAVGVLSTLGLILGVGAYRLWPMLESAPATLRVMGGEPRFAVAELIDQLFVSAAAGQLARGHYYIAPVAALALLCLRLRKLWGPWLMALLAFALAAGHFAEYAPFALLRKLPVYDTLRYPERYLVLCALSLALLTARGASLALAFARRFGGMNSERFLGACLVLAALGGIVLEARNGEPIATEVQLDPSPVVRSAAFRQSRGNRWLMSHFAAEGLGALACGEAYPVPMSRRLRADLPHEEYLVALHGQATPRGTAQRTFFSPNQLRVQVDAAEPVRLAINQNYHPGWHASVGRVESWDGLLSVVLPAGQHNVQLSFLPRSGLAGLLISAVSLLAGVLVARKRTRFDALAVSIGPVLIAATYLLWPEAPFQRPAPQTEQGAPVLLAAVPGEAQLLGARFAVPMVLEAAELPRTPLAADADEVELTLFFRRTGKLSASLGIFVHLLGPNGRVLHAEHPELSSLVYLPRMPEGAIVRDAFRVPLPRGASGTWQVRAGLWNAYADQRRSPVRDANGTSVIDDAVIVGQFTVAP